MKSKRGSYGFMNEGQEAHNFTKRRNALGKAVDRIARLERLLARCYYALNDSGGMAYHESILMAIQKEMHRDLAR